MLFRSQTNGPTVFVGCKVKMHLKLQYLLGPELHLPSELYTQSYEFLNFVVFLVQHLNSSGEVEFRSKKVLELKMLLDLATDEDVGAIRLKKLTDFLESEAPIQGVIESSGTIPSHETFDFIV